MKRIPAASSLRPVSLSLSHAHSLKRGEKHYITRVSKAESASPWDSVRIYQDQDQDPFPISHFPFFHPSPSLSFLHSSLRATASNISEVWGAERRVAMSMNRYNRCSPPSSSSLFPSYPPHHLPPPPSHFTYFSRREQRESFETIL